MRPSDASRRPNFEELTPIFPNERIRLCLLYTSHMFLASVEAVQVSEELMGKNGKFELNHAGLLVYSHGEYLNLDRTIGTFGYSVKKKKPGKKKTKK